MNRLISIFSFFVLFLNSFYRSTEPELPTSNLVDGLQQSINQPPPPSAPTASIYARIRTAEEIPIYDILDHFDDPCSYFIGPGSLIKEAIDDMEWVTGGNAGGGAGGGGTSSDKGAVGITLMRDPAGLKFSSRKQNLSLEVNVCSYNNLKIEKVKNRKKTFERKKT